MKKEIAELQKTVKENNYNFEQKTEAEIILGSLEKIDLLSHPLYSKLSFDLKRQMKEQNDNRKLEIIALTSYFVNELIRKKSVVSGYRPSKVIQICEATVFFINNNKQQSYIVQFDAEETRVCTFETLRSIVARVWNINKEKVCFYLITDSDKKVYPLKNLVYPHCLSLAENGKKVEFRLESANHLLDNVPQVRLGSLKDSAKRIQIVLNEEEKQNVFMSEIEEFAISYSKVESLKFWRFFMRTPKVNAQLDLIAKVNKEIKDIEAKLQECSEDEIDQDRLEIELEEKKEEQEHNSPLRNKTFADMSSESKKKAAS